jgi:hypothetical protein
MTFSDGISNAESKLPLGVATSHPLLWYKRIDHQFLALT